jgi:signal transduction histidine kinase
MTQLTIYCDHSHCDIWVLSMEAMRGLCYDEDMKMENQLEPGVLSVFRLLAGLRLAILLASGAAQLLLNHWPSNLPSFKYLVLLTILDAAILFGYLSWSGLQKYLHSFYLPLGILFAALGPIVEQHLAIVYNIGDRAAYPELVLSWQLIPILFIPLIITAWQYSFRSVVLFCLVTAGLDLLPILAIYSQESLPLQRFPWVGAIFVRTFTFLVVGYMVVRLMKTQRAQRSELTQANARLAQYSLALEQLTVSRERNRLARELHDILAHTLSGVAVELEAVRALWDGDPARAQGMLDHSLKATRDGLTETRRALQSLRASPLEDMGLPLAISSLAESTALRSGARLDLQLPDKVERIPPEVEQCFYRVAQEALANISQHASARHIQLSLAQQGKQLVLHVRDDGLGFEPDTGIPPERFGLTGMHERAEMIGGRLEVSSTAGQGTTVQLVYGEVPLGGAVPVGDNRDGGAA